MSPPVFQTRLTRLFGIDHPILLGGMHHLSDAAIVAAAVNAGAMGFITARSSETPEAFRSELRKCRELTGGRPFGVNLTISKRPAYNHYVAEWLGIALEEGVRHFETAGSSPQEWIRPIHDAGGLIMHKCPSVRHALSAERLGVDVIGLVGMEEGGHPGANKLSAFVHGAFALRQLKVPLVLGGGIGSGEQLAAALALGADAVVMGTRFMVASEIWAHDALKQRIVEADEHSSTTVLGTMNETWRVLYNETARKVQELENGGARRHEEYGDLILSSRTRQRVYIEGQVEEGMVSLGPACGFADRIEPAGEIIRRLMRDAERAARGLAGRMGTTGLQANTGLQPALA